MTDILLHVAVILVQCLLVMVHPVSAAAALGLGWWLRECAQANRSDLMAAIRSMPGWHLAKHLEWAAPTLAALVSALAFSWLFQVGFFWARA